MEDFNFSKAVTKFTTKHLPVDRFTLCFKLLVQQIGLIMSQGQKVCLDFTFGRLAAANRKVSFTFAAHFLTATSLLPPHHVVHNIMYTTSANLQVQGQTYLKEATGYPAIGPAI